MIVASIEVALHEMRRHPFRTTLTLSGIVIAIAAVVGVGCLLTSAGDLIEQVLNETGGLSNLHLMYKQQRMVHGRWTEAPRPNPLSERDAARLTGLPNVNAASARVTFPARITRGAVSQNATVNGVQPSFWTIQPRALAAGRLVSAADVSGDAAVALLTRSGARQLFAGESPIGAEIRLENQRFEVIGVLDDPPFRDTATQEVFVPVTTARSRFRPLARRAITLLHVQAAPGADFDIFKSAVQATILASHDAYSADDFEITTAEESQKEATQAMLLIGLVFGIIAGLCLVTGGVGVMNILLASVVERSREIGVRRAMGARRKQVFLQFLVESLALTSSGAVVGVLLGYAVGYALSFIINYVIRMGQGVSTFVLQPSLNPVVIVVAVSVSTAVGLIFGTYPALKASRMDPAEALRVE